MHHIAKTSINSLRTNLNKISSFQIKRNFLTENYYCYEQWDKYLTSDLIKNIGTVNSFAVEISEKLRDRLLVTPLDMDLLAAKLVYINNFQELEFIENLFLSFRKTQSALYVKDSLHYSFARSYLDLNQTERLLQILKLKYKYGLYIDSYIGNMLMDTFVKVNEFKNAALVAHEVMLQELNENQLTLAASLYSCFKYAQEYKVEDEPQEADESSDKKTKKVLVYFLRRPYNDEHFDLKKLSHLNGKTILFACANLKSADPILINSLKIYGFLLLEKYDKAISLLESVLIKNKSQLHHFVVEQLKTVGEKLSIEETKTEEIENFLSKWSNLIEVNEGRQILSKEIDVGKEIEKLVDEAKADRVEKDISEQTSLFEKWTSENRKEFEAQVKNVQIELKKASILHRLDSLERQEEILTFFDNQSRILNAYNGKGFSAERPEAIPIEPEESQFKARSEKHFKLWPKYANKPENFLKTSKNKQQVLDSLKKIYLDNQTLRDTKTSDRK